MAEWGTVTKEAWRLQPIVAEGHRKEEVKFAVAVGHQFRPSDNRIRMKSGTWLEALAYSRQQTAQNGLGLHDLAIEDAHSAHQPAKPEQYDNCLFVVLRTAQLVGEPHHLEFGETHIFVGPRYVVPARHGSLRSHVGLRARSEASQRLLAKGPGFVLYAL